MSSDDHAATRLPNRRALLQSCAAAAVTLPGGRPARRKDILVDTHLHCFAGSTDARFPYHPNAPYQPGEAATPEHLLNCMGDAGVQYAVVVHPEPYQDDHRYLEYCLDIGNRQLKGTCLFFADQPNAVQRMQQLAARLPIVAARIHAYAPDRLPPFDSPELTAYWKATGDAGLCVQLHLEPRYAPRLEPLIRRFPDTCVIIDHLGRPFQGTPDEHEVVVQWSRFPNTIMKLSSIPSTRNYPHRDPTAVIRRLCDHFGPDRMIYGGGFGSDATGDSYRAAFETARSFLSHWSAADQSKVLGENAARLFGFV